MLDYSLSQLVLACATALGAWGGFPSPPRLFVEHSTQSEIVQLLLVWFLVWQGGGQQDTKLSALITGALYSLKQFLD